MSKFSKSEETNKMIDALTKCRQENLPINKELPIELALLDMAKSLSIIADAMTKEELEDV